MFDVVYHVFLVKDFERPHAYFIRKVGLVVEVWLGYGDCSLLQLMSSLTDESVETSIC